MPAGSSIERDLRLRLAAMDWLRAFGDDHEFSRGELAEFRFEGTRIPLIDAGRGIRKPANMEAVLSVLMVFTPPDAVPPYADEAGSDGFCATRSGAMIVSIRRTSPCGPPCGGAYR